MNDVLELGSSLLVPNISRDLNGSAIECSASNACGNDSKLTYVVVQCESRLLYLALKCILDPI